MDELPLRLRTFLSEAAERLRDARLPQDVGEAVERLSGQVDQPCVVAVVGRMKAGKSTFINALLGEDLAKVGATIPAAVPDPPGSTGRGRPSLPFAAGP